ncbi:MAG: hypothetical protein U0694_03195 [Anaerolineae bacterium]
MAAQTQSGAPLTASAPTQTSAPTAPLAQTVTQAAQPGSELEYSTLRDEMLRRVDSRQQSISIILGMAGGFLGVGWGAGAIVLLIYPVIALLLGAAWSQNEIRIAQLSAYLAELENRIPNLGWERYYRLKDRDNKLGSWSLEVLAVAGILLLTQWLAFGLGFYQFSMGTSLIHWLMLALDILAIIALLALVNYIARRVRAIRMG